ncbi:disintegrin and metalloproteinase domain-containing protein 33 isoform X2 [Corythoichthys intestinalis]|uniref:disintegrin and metalloproteinase domain-containing protein 33 isoform X2 n=1 Tax=Corythoichthys intestinalis TaxID=161448 RepID=UPI0025A51DC3|nr:disintegrin and metalloproteinase domain-containing protein 33 isoform X2 [Corythoichthys intestinalis]
MDLNSFIFWTTSFENDLPILSGRRRIVPPGGGDLGHRVKLHGLQRGRAVTTRWLSQGRIKREADAAAQDERPIRGEIALSSGDLQLVLRVQHNHELLAPGFTETYYAEDGRPVTATRRNHTDHCFYHGDVRGHPHSWVALSTCSGVRGLISLNSNHTYYLEPTENAGYHSLLPADQLEFKGGNCGRGAGEPSRRISDLLGPRRSRVKRNTWGTTKYMELYIVADNTLFKRQNRDYDKIKTRIMEIANYVDKFYRALNIRVPLIGLEVWTERDQCMVSEEPNATLWSFLQWRQKLKSRKKHDNAQLLTGVIFKGTTIGMAPLEGMCSPENSGGINVDHSELSVGAAATMAHEIGHNFGMSHDRDGCCAEAAADQGGCVMAAATGHPFPKVFSQCSKSDLDNYFQKGGGMCLYDRPDMKDLVGGKRCGNGFVEDGEECDCGQPDECANDCCNANNCTLKEAAQCAHGVCCQACKLKQAGTMCRGPAGGCDLPEYCTGASPYCPANVYLLDGSACQYGRAYCYNGMCLTHRQQCLQLWGSGARPAHDACFEDVNAAGNAFGNCGKDERGNYVVCAKSDAKCGKIQCHSAAKKPKGTNAVSIDTTIKTGGVEVKCRGTYVYSTQDGQGDLPDPGLVATGTKCGEGKVCRDRRCQNASFSELNACISRCHGNGVCNSNGNCHCHGGWAPPFCDKPGLGGSVDSGPVQHDSQVGLVVGLFLAFLVVLPTVLLLFYCYRIKTSYFRKWLAQREKNKSDKAEKAKKNGHLNPAFHLKVVGPTGKASGREGFSASGKEALPLRPDPAVRAPNAARPPRPRPPVPTAPRKSPRRRGPPEKPLPVDPARSPPPRPSPSPPRRPLPLGPASRARAIVAEPSPSLLVAMPPAGVLGVSAGPPFKALRWGFPATPGESGPEESSTVTPQLAMTE